MFAWLVEEMASINTHKFHLVDGPLPPEKRKLVETTEIPVPPSYKNFVIQFGNAQLYRKGSHYVVQIYAVPQDAESEEGEPLLNIGKAGMGWVYFKESLLVEGEESPIFEWRYRQGLRQTADGFEAWLRKKCTATRKQFKKKEWRLIEEGPAPFTEQEQAIVDARSQFRWRVVGIAASGDLQFEVHNGSEMVLPYLSIGIRGKIHGGVYLPIGEIQPGETRVIERGCYKDYAAAEEVEAYEKPEPGPEDRQQYWEFKALKKTE